MNKVLEASELATFIAGISIIDLNDLLSTVVLAISAIVGLINLGFKIKGMLKDGKIDKQEAEEIKKEIEEIKENIDEHLK